MADTSSLEQKAVEIITNLEKLAEPAMQLTLRSVQISAIIDAFLSALALAVLAFIWIRYAPRVVQWCDKTDSDVVIPISIGGLIACIGTVILVIAAACTLFSASTWLAMFAPDLALAKLLLNKVT